MLLSYQHSKRAYIIRSFSLHQLIHNANAYPSPVLSGLWPFFDRLVARLVDWDGFNSLDRLGIDEITLKNGHVKYMTDWDLC
jgi:hypothetical protein